MKKIVSLLLFMVVLFSVSFIAADNVNIVNSRAEAAMVNKVQALHILVPTEQQAIEIRKEILAGQTQQEIFNNFMNAAKKYSKCPSGSSGGILGWFGRGDMVPEFEKAAFELTPGTVSEPVKTQFGWHLIYVISKK